MVARIATLLTAFALLLAAGKHEKKNIGQAANDAVEITATALADSESVKQALGSDLDNHYILIQVQLTPKGGKPLPVHLDDFLLRTDKDGERTTPFLPSQMVGDSALVVSQTIIGGNGSQGEQRGPIWGGMPGTGSMPRRMGGDGASMGNGAGATGSQAKMNKGAKGKEDPMLAVLKQKMLPEKETDQPVAGLLYFPMEKQKLKDLELIYTTSAGKLNLRFK